MWDQLPNDGPTNHNLIVRAGVWLDFPKQEMVSV